MGAFDLILGPILMGSFFNVLLYGIMLIQTYNYFDRYKQDKWWIRSIVSFIFTLDTLSSAFAMLMTYNYLVTNFANPAGIATTNLGLDPYPLLTGITAAVVQIFYAWRIHVLTKSRFLAGLIVVLSIVQMFASIGTMIGGLILKDFSKLIKTKQVSLVWLLGSVVTDALITGSLVLYLRRNRTGYQHTDDVLTKLIQSIVQTGLLTTTCALGVVIAFLAADATTLHLAFGLPLSKLYTNSLMSTLNARGAWSGEGFTTAMQDTAAEETHRSGTLSFAVSAPYRNQGDEAEYPHRLSDVDRKTMTPERIAMGRIDAFAD